MKVLFLALFLHVMVTETQHTCRLSKKGHIKRFEGLNLRRKLCKPSLVVGDCNGNWSVILDKENNFLINSGNETVVVLPNSTTTSSEFTVDMDENGKSVSVTVPTLEDLCGNCIDEEEEECKPVDVIGTFFF